MKHGLGRLLVKLVTATPDRFQILRAPLRLNDNAEHHRPGDLCAPEGPATGHIEDRCLIEAPVPPSQAGPGVIAECLRCSENRHEQENGYAAGRPLIYKTRPYRLKRCFRRNHVAP